jgi:Flp pilus assembly secretin CpaC
MVRRLFAILCLALCTAAVCPGGESASSLAKRARKAEKAGDVVKAYLLYAEAAAADPKNHSYWVRSQALQTRAMRASNTMPSSLTELPPPEEKKEERKRPEFIVGTNITREEVEESRRPLPPQELKGVPGKKSFDLKANARALFTRVTQSFGLDLVFDADYAAAGPTIRFQLNDVDLHTALYALEAATSSFAVPLSEKLLMIYKDTQQKRTEAEPNMAVTLSIPNPVTVQEAQELARAVQQVLEIKRFAIDGAQRLVLIKDRVGKVRTAQALYEQLLTLRSQAMVEVELVELSESHELHYGFSLPTSTAIAFLGRRGPNTHGLRMFPDFAPGFTKFLVAGGGISTIALAISDVSAFASVANGRSVALFKTEIRSLDSQEATVHIGDKYPIVTQQFTGSGGISPYATPSTFNFEDLGLVLKLTPRIHSSQEVSLQVDAEFKVLGSSSYNGIPVIQNRKFASVVRLKEGEEAVLAGLMSVSEARNISGIAGLASVPILSQILTERTVSKQAGQVLVVIRPHIIDGAPSETITKAIYTGTEGRWTTLPFSQTR